AHRQDGRRGDGDPRRVHRAHAVQRARRTRRGRAAGRGGFRWGVEVSRPGQVRPARLDGVEGRDRQVSGNPAAGGGRMSTGNEETTSTQTQTAEVDEALVEEITDALKDVIDPELGVNVVDLGLVYGVNVDERSIVIDMTLTSAACPLTDVLEEQVASTLDEFDRDVKINWV